MKLKVLGSSSKGNCYILTEGDVAIILECGIPFMEVKKALNFNISKIKFVLLSHSHGDHAGHAPSFLKAGIQVAASPETIAASKFNHHNWTPIEAGIEYFADGISFTAFEVAHDVRCFGYRLKTMDGNTFAFITDTHYVKHRLRGLTNLIIECNFDDEIIDSNGTPTMLRNRVRTSHMSLDTLKDFLQLTDISKVHNIVLIHLSDKNSHATRFKKEIELLTGKTVHIAEPEMEIDFNAKPF